LLPNGVVTNYEDKDDEEDEFVDTIALLFRLWTDVTTGFAVHIPLMGSKFTASELTCFEGARRAHNGSFLRSRRPRR
jgi:hypothetical protein